MTHFILNLKSNSYPVMYVYRYVLNTLCNRIVTYFKIPNRALRLSSFWKIVVWNGNYQRIISKRETIKCVCIFLKQKRKMKRKENQLHISIFKNFPMHLRFIAQWSRTNAKRKHYTIGKLLKKWNKTMQNEQKMRKKKKTHKMKQLYRQYVIRIIAVCSKRRNTEHKKLYSRIVLIIFVFQDVNGERLKAVKSWIVEECMISFLSIENLENWDTHVSLLSFSCPCDNRIFWHSIISIRARFTLILPTK